MSADKTASPIPPPRTDCFAAPPLCVALGELAVEALVVEDMDDMEDTEDMVEEDDMDDMDDMEEVADAEEEAAEAEVEARALTA